MSKPNTNNNLTLAMYHFGQLNATERELFLSVAVANNVQPAKVLTIDNVPTEDYYYNELVKNHASSVAKRVAKYKTKGRMA